MAVRVGVLGATGYAGLMLLRWLASHPELEVAAAASAHAAGEPMDGFMPPHARLPRRLVSVEQLLDASPQLVFSAMGNGQGMEIFRALLGGGALVVDLAATFRFATGEEYARYYGPHPDPELLAKSFSGYADFPKMAYADDRVILGNPGCYPTAFALAVGPLVDAFGPMGTLLVDGKSGVTGAGRSPKVPLLMGEMAENVEAYNDPGAHRHTAEMEAVAGSLVVFQPHLMPMAQGLALTIYCPDSDIAVDAVLEVWDAWYGNNPFVTRLSQGKPKTRWTRDSNRAILAAARDERTRTLVLYAAIDNLVKGAAGHAIQHVNRWMGWPMATGLA